MQMQITLNVSENYIIKYSEKILIYSITLLYGWIVNANTVLLGHILGVYHVMIAMAIAILIFLSHTFYPSFWIQLICIICLIIIWLQHIFLKVCVVTMAENKLTNGDKSPFFYGIINDLFGISEDTFINNIIIIETVAILCLGLSITSRVSVNIYKLYNIHF